MTAAERRDALRDRTKIFAIDICRFAKTVRKDDVSSVLTKQLIRSGTSVGANQRSATLAKSDADLLNKLKTVEEEADESAVWMELIVELGYSDQGPTDRLIRESYQLRNIATAGVKTLRSRLTSR